MQAAQQAVCQRALATLSAEDSEDLYFSGGQHVTELHAALVRILCVSGCLSFM